MFHRALANRTLLPSGLLVAAVLLAAAAVQSAAAAGTATADADDQALLAGLVALSGEIEEAVRVGDKAAIERLALPEMILVNRDGRTYNRQQLMDELVPPRPGYDLRFTLLEPTLLHQGDVAVLSYVLDEYLTIYGVDVSTEYRNNFTFFRRDGAWKLALFEYFERPVDPTVIAVEPASYEPLVGTYEIGPGHWVTEIRREGDRLVSSRDGGPARELQPFAPDRFFYPGVEGEIFFVRDGGGRVTGMVFRRNFKDIPYRRIR